MNTRITAAMLGLLLGLGGAACSTEPNRDDAGAITEEGELDAFSIKLGDCMQQPEVINDEFQDVAVVPCAEAHDLEAIHIFDLSETGTYPGDNEVFESAQDTCISKFDKIVGTPYLESAIDVSSFYPTADSWDAGDREVICIAFGVDGNPLTGSVQGSEL